MVVKCSIVGEDTIAAGEASIPPEVWSDLGLDATIDRDVRLRLGRQRVYLRAVRREGAAGREVWARPAEIGVAAAQPRDGRVETIRASAARWYLVTGTADGRLALVGLALTIIGLAAQACSALGDGGPLGDIGKPARATLTAAAIVIQIVGLVLLFWRGVLRRQLG